MKKEYKKGGEVGREGKGREGKGGEGVVKTWRRNG